MQKTSASFRFRLTMGTFFFGCILPATVYKKMLRTSRLIYNDHVTRLNRELRLFPTSLLVGIFGFQEREYLEAEEE